VTLRAECAVGQGSQHARFVKIRGVAEDRRLKLLADNVILQTLLSEHAHAVRVSRIHNWEATLGKGARALGVAVKIKGVKLLSHFFKHMNLRFVISAFNISRGGADGNGKERKFVKYGNFIFTNMRSRGKMK
jgi:hypothetical protein